MRAHRGKALGTSRRWQLLLLKPKRIRQLAMSKWQSCLSDLDAHILSKCKLNPWTVELPVINTHPPRPPLQQDSPGWEKSGLIPLCSSSEGNKRLTWSSFNLSWQRIEGPNLQLWNTKLTTASAGIRLGLSLFWGGGFGWRFVRSPPGLFCCCSHLTFQAKRILKREKTKTWKTLFLCW